MDENQAKILDQIMDSLNIDDKEAFKKNIEDMLESDEIKCLLANVPNLAHDNKRVGDPTWLK